MKRQVLIKKIRELGCKFVRHGGRHDWYQNLESKISQPIPRHREINDNLARHIIKILSKKN